MKLSTFLGVLVVVACIAQLPAALGWWNQSSLSAKVILAGMVMLAVVVAVGAKLLFGRR